MLDAVGPWILLGMLIGLVVGFFITEWGWRTRIREKAATGFRLELTGDLYWIVPKSKENCACRRCGMPVQYPGAGFCDGCGPDYEQGER